MSKKLNNFSTSNSIGPGTGSSLILLHSRKDFSKYLLSQYRSAIALRISERPHVKPLADLMDFYGGYGIALVDKIDAHLLLFSPGGKLIEEAEISGESIRRTKRGGGSQAQGTPGWHCWAKRTTLKKSLKEISRDAAEFAARFLRRETMFAGC